MDELLTVKEVSKLLKVNVNKVYDLIKYGYLPALKLGSYKVRKMTLMKFMEDNEGLDLTILDSVSSIEMKK